MGWGVFRALSFVRDVLLRDLAPGWMVLRDLSTGWRELRDLFTGGGVLGDHSLDLADPRDLSTGWRDLGDLSLEWEDLLGDLSFDWCFLWDPSSELDRDLGISWNLTWDCGLFW